MGPAALLLILLVVALVVAFMALVRGEEKRRKGVKPRLRSIGDALERVKGRPGGGVLIEFVGGGDSDELIAKLEDPSLDDVMRPFECVRIDASGDGREAAEALAKKYGESGLKKLPFVMFLDATGKHRGTLEIEGKDVAGLLMAFVAR